MALKFNKVLALVKIETTYGTDAAPTPGANAVLLQDVTITPMEADKVTRKIIRPYLGADPFVLVGKRLRMQATIDLAGAGAAGTAPAYGPILRACGMAEVITAGTKVEYTPVSANEESATMWLNLDGIYHKGPGARGTFSLSANTKDYAKFNVNFTGFYLAPVAGVPSAPDYTAWKDPEPVGFDYTPVFTLDGYAAAMSSFSYDHANEVQLRDRVNRKAITISDREPSGKVTIETVPLATKDFYAIAAAGTKVALAFQQGSVAGKIVEVSLPTVQLAEPTYSDDAGEAMLNMDLTPLPNTGNDEIKITVR